MDKEQILQVSELRKRIIRGANGLSTFFPADANTNVGFQKHRHIITAISYAQSDPLPLVLVQTYHVCLLFGAHPATNQALYFEWHLEEPFLQIPLTENHSQYGTLNSDYNILSSQFVFNVINFLCLVFLGQPSFRLEVASETIRALGFFSLTDEETDFFSFSFQHVSYC